MADLIEIVARAIRKDDGSPCISSTRNMCRRKDGCICLSLAAAVLAALRDPPPEVVEAGAMAVKHELRDYFSETPLDDLDEPIREWWKTKWLASWRAALDATPPHRPESETQNTAC